MSITFFKSPGSGSSVWGVKGIWETNAQGRRQLELSQQSADWKRLQRGWCWGPKGFREEMLELVGEQQGRQHYGEELREAEEQKAERLVAQMMRQGGWGKRR